MVVDETPSFLIRYMRGQNEPMCHRGKLSMARWGLVVGSLALVAPPAARGQACVEPHYRWSEKIDTALQTRPAKPVDIATILTAWAPVSLTSRDTCAPWELPPVYGVTAPG